MMDWSRAVTESSVWLSMQKGEWTAAHERSFKEWLSENPVHAEAYEHVQRTEIQHSDRYKRLRDRIAARSH